MPDAMPRTADPLHPRLSELECSILQGRYLLSARRLWEHGFVGQVDVTEGTISHRFWSEQVPRYIDIASWVDGVETLVGTLHDLEQEACLGDSHLAPLRLQTDWRRQPEVKSLMGVVERYLYRLSHRQGYRGLLPRFWSPGLGPVSRISEAVLGVPGLYSRLVRHLQAQPRARHTAGEWLRHFGNLQARGIRQEEWALSGLPAWLTDANTRQPERRWTPPQ
jgi:hypothetical protein